MTLEHEKSQNKKSESTGGGRWHQISILSELVGGALVASSGLALFTVLSEREFEFVTPIAVVGFFLLVGGLWAYYESERAWFGRLGKLSFWMMSGGTIITAISLPIADYGPGVAFIGFLFGLLITMFGAIGFGIAMLRKDIAPRSAAWLFILALPIGVPLTIAFTTFVMGEGADPWGGPMVFYGVAWMVLGYHLRIGEQNV
ncbi:hypothetical protein [Haloarcula sp. 1CSR25-25]|uniref:hypothetical protein n=1 Tax=Haloarcula sp. 1CSR25-25 TaxID=2862545 RepID=UPI0028946FC7|nr:hypothetical protein [Haloarcula sp. 1CSR25-25]MDT3435972.1 hypothetical protein [Haloarcula sp. 1CSR25-25]